MDHRPARPTASLASAAALTMIVLAGCSAPTETARVNTFPGSGSGSGSSAASAPGTAPSSADASTSPSAPATSPVVPTTPAKSSAAPGRAPKGAYPGAGGPIPAGAIDLPTFRDVSVEVAAVKTPTGNIGCDFSGDYSSCGAISYRTENKYGSDPHLGPRWELGLSEGVPTIGARTDAPYWAFSGQGYVLAYGKVGRYKHFVCASEETGLTCWNTKTGHGVWMRRAGFKAF